MKFARFEFGLSDVAIFWILFTVAFAFYSSFVPSTIGGDAVSIYYPAERLAATGSVNLYDQFNDRYDTLYFTFPFTDVVIKDFGQHYAIQFVGTLLVYAGATTIGGDLGFFLVSPLFGALGIALVYLMGASLFRARLGGFFSSVVLMVMPVYVFWAVLPQNIMVSTALLLASILLALDTRLYSRLGSGLTLGLSVFARYPHIMFLPALAVLIYVVSRDKGRSVKPNAQSTLKSFYPFFLGLMTILGFALVMNHLLFGDSLFIGVLWQADLPGGSLPSGPYSRDLLRLDGAAIASSALLFLTSAGAFSPFFWLGAIGIAVSFVFRQKALVLLAILTAVPALIYYGSIEPLLWRPETGPLPLGVTFHRYLLPVYSVAALGFGFLASRFIRNLRWTHRLFASLLAVLVLSSVVGAYNFPGDGDLSYVSEFEGQVVAYAPRIQDLIPEGSVVLMSSRWVIQYFSPDAMSIHWFYYDGIPSSLRASETLRVLEELHRDSVRVYFPLSNMSYETLDDDMYELLASQFDLVRVPGSDFPRMKTVFFEVRPARS